MTVQLTPKQQELISTKFVDAVDFAIVSEPEVQGYRAPHLYPSSASVITADGRILGSCARKEFFRLCQTEALPCTEGLVSARKLVQSIQAQASQQYIFLSGVMWENAVADLAKKAGIFDSQHIKWQIPSLHVSGELDIVLKSNFANQGKPVFVEMKTTNGYFNATKIFKNGHPKDENLLQAALYAYKFRDIMAGGKLVYYDRGDVQNRREFTILFHLMQEEIGGRTLNVGRISVDGELVTDWTVNGIFQRYKFIWDKYEALEVPAQEFTPYFTEDEVRRRAAAKQISGGMAKKLLDASDPDTCGEFQCNYCPFREACVALEEGKIPMDVFRQQAAAHRKFHHNIPEPADLREAA